MAGMVSPSKIAAVMGLRQKVSSLRDLSNAVQNGLPPSALVNSLERVFPDSVARTEYLHQVIPEATFRRRTSALKADESERTERIARVIATAEYVWNDPDEARQFLRTEHPQLEGKAPMELALSELGARQVEEILWKLFYGIAA